LIVFSAFAENFKNSEKGRGEEAAEILLRDAIKPNWSGEK
jgi:hypothetical protein